MSLGERTGYVKVGTNQDKLVIDSCIVLAIQSATMLNLHLSTYLRTRHLNF